MTQEYSAPVQGNLFGFRLPLDPLPHHRFKEGLHHIDSLHCARRIYGQGGAFLLVGPSGFGKSLLIKHYEQRYPRVSQQSGDLIPVLRVSVPPAPTAKSLGEVILGELGYRKAHRGSAAEKMAVILELFKKCGIEMLLFDEFHHLFYAPTVAHFRDVTDWLKNLISLSNIGIVGCGLPEAEAVVDANEQLSRRFSSRYRLTPFSLEEKDFLEFRSVLKSLQLRLPFPTEIPLHEANLARRFLIGSYGLLDYVSKILEGAVAVCVESGLSSIDLQVLAEGFRQRVWREVPDRLNPFHPESYLRPLDRVGEVFYLHVSQDLVGSAISKRICLNNLKGAAR